MNKYDIYLELLHESLQSDEEFLTHAIDQMIKKLEGFKSSINNGNLSNIDLDKNVSFMSLFNAYNRLAHNIKG